MSLLSAAVVSSDLHTMLLMTTFVSLKNLQTNTKSEYERGSYCDETFTDEHGRGRRVVKGEEIGEFNLGSTIVLLFEAPANFRFNVTPGGAVNYGQGIGHVCRGKHRKAKSRRHASRK